MATQTINRWLLVCCATLLWTDVATAQPRPGKEPSSTHIFPSGGRRGTVVQVRVGTEVAPPDSNFWISGRGILAPEFLTKQLHDNGEPSPRRVPTEIPIKHPREWQSKIKIADDAPLGPAFWRLSCASGGTASRPFIVGDLPEWIETESNSTADRAEKIEIPITLNGQINAERDVDYYRFIAPAGKVVVCELIAARIGSRLDGIVEILDSQGLTVPTQQIYRGTDPVIAFRARESSVYLLRVSNVSWHGSPAHVYRINLSTQPYVHFAFPAGGQQGTTQQVKLFTLSGTDEYHVTTKDVKLPATFQGEFVHDNVPLAVDESPNTTEQEPNDDASAPMKINVPVTVNGQIHTKTDEDWFEIIATKGDKFTINGTSFPSGGAALLTIALFDSKQKRLAQIRSIESTDRVCRVEWQAPADGLYSLRVADMQHGARGGPDFIYRLSIRKAKSDFSLSIVSDNVNLTQGNETKIDFQLNRIGGFDDAVEIQLENLPKGVTATENMIAKGKASGAIKLKATEDIGAASHTLRIIGRATIDDEQVERVAQARHLGVDGQGVSIGSPTIDRVHLTVLHKPLFLLQCSEHYQYAHRGTVYPYLMDVQRLEDYDGPILLQQGDRQNRDMDGVRIHDAVIAAGETETTVPIYLPETMHINVQGQTQLYTQGYVQFVDQHNKKQSMLFLSEKRNMIRSLPAIVSLQAVDDELAGAPGAEIACRLKLKRTSNFSGPMTMELVDAPVGIESKPVQIPARENNATIMVRIHSNLSAPDDVTLRFRAAGQLYDNRQVISEATIQLRIE